ncbi:uncharacterized protein [Diadema antillarum]|uniref:uncharacterized protein n=1 Tax=Diadema antillarum TaxID=105358 RepID=UPI003A88AEAD
MDVQEALAVNHLYASLWTVKNPSCHGPEAKREQQTYTDWMNKQLISAVEQPLIYNLEMSLADGTTLSKITDILACQKLVWPHPRPALLPHRLDNVRACLVHLLRFGVDLTGVLAEDIVHGDPKTALALSRAIYTRFQRHPQMTSPRVHHSSSPVQPQSVSNSPRLGDSQYLSSSLDSSSSFWANPSPVPMATADRAHTSQLSSHPIRPGDQHYFSPSLNSSASWATALTVPVATKDDMAVFGWVERLLRVPVTRYEQ